MSRASNILLVLAVLLATAAIGLYVYKFAFPNNFELSSNLETWSHFGGYVGGVLGPIFAFLAFIGVLATVHLQHRQIVQMKKQSHIDELQRLISGISTRIDDALNSSPSVLPEQFNNRDHPFNIWRMVSAAGTAALKSANDPANAATYSEVINSVKYSVSHEINSITIEINQLIWCLEQYLKIGGSDVIENYYKKRYEVLICWLDSINLIDNYSRIQSYLRPKEFRKYLNPDGAEMR